MATTTQNPQLEAARRELEKRAAARGLRVTVNSADRSPQEQARLYANRAQNPYPVAKPGQSAHERRRALDLGVTRVKDGARVDPGEIADLAAEVGLRWHGAGDRVHFELAEAPAVEARPPVAPTEVERALARRMLGDTPGQARPLAARGGGVPAPASVAATDTEKALARRILATRAEAQPAAAEPTSVETAIARRIAQEAPPTARPAKPVRFPKPAAVPASPAVHPEFTKLQQRPAAELVAAAGRGASITPIPRAQVGKPLPGDKPRGKGPVPSLEEAGYLLRNLPKLFDPQGEGRGDLSQLRVLDVLDGDTIDVLVDGKAQRIRFHAVDAPEKAQAFGPESRAYTAGKVGGRRVQIRVKERDKYGRMIGTATTPEVRNLNEELTREGLAWWYRQYGAGALNISAAEAEARAAKRGVWSQGNPTPPWEYRRTGAGAKAGQEPRKDADRLTIDPRTLTIPKPPGTAEKVGRFMQGVFAGRTVAVDEAAAAAVRELEAAGEIRTPKLVGDRAQRARQERRLQELRGHVEAFDRLLDERAQTEVARLPYQPPGQDQLLGPATGPNDPRYLARGQAAAAYRAGYRKTVEAAYGQQRERWGWPELGPFLKARGITLSAWDKGVLDSAIRAKRTEWRFRPAHNAAVGADILQGALDLMGGEITGVAVAHFAGPPLKAAAAWAKNTGKAGVVAAREMAQGGLPRLPREVRYLVQSAPNYLESLGTGGQELARDLRRLGGELAKKQGRTGVVGDDLLQLKRHEAVRLWGEELVRAERAIAKIAKERSPAEAERVRRFLRYDVMGDAAYAPKPFAPKVAQGLSTYETLSKLGGRPATALRNWTQRFTNSSLEYGFTPIVRAQVEMTLKPWREASRKLWHEAHRAGVFVGENAAQEGKLTGKMTNWLLAGFDRAEQGNRFIAARVRQLGLEQDLALLTKLPSESDAVRRLKAIVTLGARTEGATVRRLGRSGIEAARVKSLVASGGRFTEEEVVSAMQRAVRDEQFAMDLVSSPLWWENAPWLRAMGKFKPFAVKQWKLFQNVAWQELRKGNAAPMTRYVGATIVAGEMYNGFRDLALGGKRSVSAYAKGQQMKEADLEAQQIGKRLLRNFQDGGGLGLLTDLMFGHGSDDKWDEVAELLVVKGQPREAWSAAQGVLKAKAPELIGGPVVGTVQNVQKALQPMKPTPAEKRAVELMKKEIPAVRDAGQALRKHLPKSKPESIFQDRAEPAEQAERQERVR